MTFLKSGLNVTFLNVFQHCSESPSLKPTYKDWSESPSKKHSCIGLNISSKILIYLGKFILKCLKTINETDSDIPSAYSTYHVLQIQDHSCESSSSQKSRNIGLKGFSKNNEHWSKSPSQKCSNIDLISCLKNSTNIDLKVLLNEPMNIDLNILLISYKPLSKSLS